jgi:hypothetical protein
VAELGAAVSGCCDVSAAALESAAGELSRTAESYRSDDEQAAAALRGVEF